MARAVKKQPFAILFCSLVEEMAKRSQNSLGGFYPIHLFHVSGAQSFTCFIYLDLFSFLFIFSYNIKSKKK